MSATKSHAPSSHPARVSLGPERWVSIRPIERADASVLSDFYASLSPESRRRRFMCAGQAPSLGPLAEAEGLVGILREPGPRDGALVAHASIQPDEVGGCEVAFAVADALQRRGIGRVLVRRTLARARAIGFVRAEASLLADNVAMRRLLRETGGRVSGDVIDIGVEEISLDLITPALASAG